MISENLAIYYLAFKIQFEGFYWGREVDLYPEKSSLSYGNFFIDFDSKEYCEKLKSKELSIEKSIEKLSELEKKAQLESLTICYQILWSDYEIKKSESELYMKILDACDLRLEDILINIDKNRSLY